MKRIMPTSLIDFLDANRNCIKADLFDITLPTGAHLYATEGQWSITVPAGTPGWSGGQTTFQAQQHGAWARGAITSEAGFNCSSTTMSLTCCPQPNTYHPGLPIGILYAAFNRLFDGCDVRVYTAYMPLGQYGNVAAGIETKFRGTITRIPGTARNRVEFECADPMYLLNTKVPTRVIQSNCPWSFCDSNCALPKSDYTVSFTAKTGSSAAIILPLVAFTQPVAYFDQGVVTCLTGANAGLSQTVKIHSSIAIVPMVPWLFPVVAGDTFSVIKGCDKTLATCRSMAKANGAAVNNVGRFGGTPFVPVPSVTI